MKTWTHCRYVTPPGWDKVKVSDNLPMWIHLCTVPKWVLIVRLKIPLMPQNLSTQKFGISKKKGFIRREYCGQATLNEWVTSKLSVMQLQKPARMLMLTTLGYCFAILCNYFRLKLQVNLFQKLSFVNQLTHNMTEDCSFIYQFNTWKVQAQNMERTCCAHKLFWMSKQKQKTIFVHKMFWGCSFHVMNW